MNKYQKDEIRKNIKKLQDWGATPSYREAEEILFGILEPLLAEEGYSVKSTPPVRDGGLDFIAERNENEDFQKTTIGIEYKHYQRQPVSLNVIHQVVGASFIHGFNRAMVVANTRFSKQAREIIKQSLPIEVELIDPDALRAWWVRVEIDCSIDRPEINIIIKTVSWQFARLVAENPNVLNELEWRQVEQLLAEVFEGIGFEVELTPCSKDGGKDIILECFVKGSKHTYIIEIKHWRSGTLVGQKAVREFLDVISRS